VSSTGQSADLDRQRELLSHAFPDAEIISDIGSGLNYHKPGFTALVRKICRDQVSQVIITFKDRLCRFGYELLELVCKEHGCSILVYGNGIDQPEAHDPDFELKEDLLSIVNVFVASHNGKRAQLLKRERERLAEDEGIVEYPNQPINDNPNAAIGGILTGNEKLPKPVKGPGRRKVVKAEANRDNQGQALPNNLPKEEVKQIV
jgi:predicted site-specific integrase-resolvase